MSLWPYNVLIRYAIDTFQIPNVLSTDPEARYSPFGENAKLKTKFLWP